jgi:hypothetical protein
MVISDLSGAARVSNGTCGPWVRILSLGSLQGEDLLDLTARNTSRVGRRDSTSVGSDRSTMALCNVVGIWLRASRLWGRRSPSTRSFANKLESEGASFAFKYMPVVGVGVRAGTKTVAAAELCRLRDKHSTMVGSLFDRVHFANRFVHNLVGGFHQYHSLNADSNARTAVGVEMVEEDSQLLDVRLRLPGDLLNTTHKIVKVDGVGAEIHSQCRSESMEILLVEDDVLSFVTFKVLGRILKYLNTVVLEESFLRYMMEGLIEYNIHDNKRLPHIKSELVDAVREIVNTRLSWTAV